MKKTLEQLIDDCGDGFQYLTRSGHLTGDKLWFHEHYKQEPIFGATPRDVIEKLWQKIHNVV